MSDGKKTTYSSVFKEEAVRLSRQGGRSYRQVYEELGIKDKKSLREWVSKVNSGKSLEDGRGKTLTLPLQFRISRFTCTSLDLI